MNFIFGRPPSATEPLALWVTVDKNKNLSFLGEGPSSALRRAQSEGFQAKAGSLFTGLSSDEKPHQRIWLVGVGPTDECDEHHFRLAAAALARQARDARVPRIHMGDRNGVKMGAFPIEPFVEGWILGSYEFLSYKSSPAGKSFVTEVNFIHLASSTNATPARRSVARARAANLARDLINRPASDKTPMSLAKVARSLAGQGVRVRVYGKSDLARMGAGALLGVNRGSAHPPALVHLQYRPRQASRRSVALVGKGVTFDSGGLSLKPADGMMTMKYDMAGAATVFAVFDALRHLRPDVEVHGIAALTENMPGPDAYKPGDVVKAMNGKTIEVLNTDAEGRVILADALSFAVRLKPDAIVDVATLTGAASVALGKSYGALMTDDVALESGLQKAAGIAGEKLWPLPLEKSYFEHIQSKVADIKNIGNPGEAGTIVGGLFLKEFVGTVPWAHIDMASVGWNSTGSLLSPPGATGALVRTLIHFICGEEK